MKGIIVTGSVTMDMLTDAGMTRLCPDKYEIGVPVDPKNRFKGVQWKEMGALVDEDFDKIEEYFEERKKRLAHGETNSESRATT